MGALKPECFSFISQQLELETRRPGLIRSEAEGTVRGGDVEGYVHQVDHHPAGLHAEAVRLYVSS